VKYIELLGRNSIIYIAYILDPCCKVSMIKEIMLSKYNTILLAVKKYFITEWPGLTKDNLNLFASLLVTLATLETQPPSILITH
jgi:hypothetical protein